jgi:hypothetical protein
MLDLNSVTSSDWNEPEPVVGDIKKVLAIT